MYLGSKNKGANQTARMRRLICAFVVRIWQKQVFSWRGSYCFFVWKVITSQSKYLTQIDFNPETFGTFEEEKDIVGIFLFTVHVSVRLLWRHQRRQRSVLHVLVLGSEIKAHALIWAATWQNVQSGCASSEDSDPPNLIRVFAVRLKKALVLNYPLSAQWRLWSD